MTQEILRCDGLGSEGGSEDPCSSETKAKVGEVPE